jgi:hypothetical protein
LTPSVWAIYTIIVFEIVFVISPFALYFYSVYGPGGPVGRLKGEC